MIVAIVILAVFGPGALSKAGKGLGKTVRSVNDLKRSLSEDALKAAAMGDSTGRREPRRATKAEAEAEAEPEPDQGRDATDRERRQG
jgi:Sec-independent protein translocase protein TatA